MSISDEFNSGGSYLLSEANARDYIYKNAPPAIGRSDGQFMIPSDQMDELLEKHPSDPRAWEKQLGLGEGSLGDYPVRVDVFAPQKYNLREPSLNNSGSNDMFVPDGKTAGGYDEAIINPFPNPTLPGNENVGRVQSLDLDLSKQENSALLFEKMQPDRRASWPSQQDSPGTAGAQKEDLPPIKQPHQPSSVTAGPESLSEIPPEGLSTALSQLSDSTRNPALTNEALDAGKKITGGLYS